MTPTQRELHGWPKVAAILWSGTLGSAIGYWAEFCLHERSTFLDEFVFGEVAEPYLFFGLLLGLLVGAFFAKLQPNIWAWLLASAGTTCAAYLAPMIVVGPGHGLAAATSIGFIAPITFAAVHGLWLVPWRRPN